MAAQPAGVDRLAVELDELPVTSSGSRVTAPDDRPTRGKRRSTPSPAVRPTFDAHLSKGALAPPKRAKQLPGRRRQWSPERVLSAAQEWAQEMGAPPRGYEWEPVAARAIGRGESAGLQRWLREYPRWPSATTATGYWGSWRAMLTEAGLPSAPPLRMVLRERLAAAQAMRDLSVSVVAEVIGVSEGTVNTYWRAPACPRCGGPKVTPHAAVCGVCVERPIRPVLPRGTVVAAIRAWARETGEQPIAREWIGGGVGKWEAEYPRWPAVQQVQETFGSWNDAMTAAGFDPRLRRWSREEIIAAARHWTELHGQPPRSEEWQSTDGSYPSSSPVWAQFPSWNAMLDAAGLEIVHRSWSRAEVLAALRAWIAEHGRTPTGEDWAYAPPAAGHPSASTIPAIFGSWNAMLSAAGVDLNRRYWTREEILDVCAEFRVRNGGSLRVSDYTNPANCPPLPSGGTIRRQVGDHQALLHALDYERGQAKFDWPGVPAGRVSDAEILERLRAFAAEHGRTPTTTAWTAAAARPVVPVIARRFGSWPAAIQAAGLPALQRTGSRWDAAAIREALERFHREHGRAPRKEDYDRLELPSAERVRAVYGSTAAALAAIGVQPGRRRASTEDVLAALRAYAAEHHDQPTVAVWRAERRWPGVEAMIRSFGSWRAALAAAGMDAPRGAWTREEILAACRRFEAVHQRRPSPGELARGSECGLPGPSTIHRHFGSERALFDELGWRVEPSQRRWTRDEILGAIERWTRFHGQPPILSAWNRADPDGTYPTHTTVTRRFGSWQAAIEAAQTGVRADTVGRLARGGERLYRRWDLRR